MAEDEALLETLPLASGEQSFEGPLGALVPGSMLDDTYRVEGILGRGAMGAVYVVEHMALGKRFAAKVVTESRALDHQAIRRLRNEARITSALEHDNIVRVTHLGTTDRGVLFIVMELLEGQSLRERIEVQIEEGGAPWLPDEETRPILSQLLSGLAAAHESGVVHRDLKPDNVFLSTKRGETRAKIVDFGISKVGPGARVDAEVGLTQTGTVVGTPLYMAPEQMRSSELTDARSDVYSVGVLAYEMLTGNVPFEATSLAEIVVMHAIEEAEPISVLRPELSARVARVIERALEKKPEDRWASATEMRRAWQSAWEDEPVVEEPVADEPDLEEPDAKQPDGVEDTEPPGLVPAAGSIVPNEPAESTKTNVRMGLWIGLLVLLLAGGAWLGTRGNDSPASESPEPAGSTRTPDESAPSAPTPAEPIPEETTPIVPTGQDIPEQVEPLAIEREIRTRPSGARVLVDGEQVGTTPYTFHFAAGSEVVAELRRNGYVSQEHTLTETDEAVVEIRLVRRRTSHQPELAPLMP